MKKNCSKRKGKQTNIYVNPISKKKERLAIFVLTFHTIKQEEDVEEEEEEEEEEKKKKVSLSRK